MGNADISELMILHGADVSAVMGDMKAPLHMSVEAGMDGVMELLLSRGAEFRNGTNPTFEFSTLHLMARLGRLQMLKSVLQSSDADIDFADFKVVVFSDHIQDQTPLSLAAKHGHADVVKLILDSAPTSRNAGVESKYLHNAL